jgi:hypothetical protein
MFLRTPATSKGALETSESVAGADDLSSMVESCIQEDDGVANINT